MTDELEMHMREVLHGGSGLPAGFTAAQVIAKGQHRRRARTLTVSGFALVAAGVVVTVPNALAAGHSPAGALSAASGAPTPSVPAVPGAPVAAPAAAQVVTPGKLAIGGGYQLTLTSHSVTLADGHGNQAGPNATDDGNQAPDSISVEMVGRAVAGLYIGHGAAASATVTVDGKTYPATVVTLAGNPGWSVASTVLPAAPTANSGFEIRVYDAAGHQLASFKPDPAALAPAKRSGLSVPPAVR